MSETPSKYKSPEEIQSVAEWDGISKVEFDDGFGHNDIAYVIEHEEEIKKEIMESDTLWQFVFDFWQKNSDLAVARYFFQYKGYSVEVG